MSLCAKCSRPLQLGKPRCIYCGAVVASAPHANAVTARDAAPPGRTMPLPHGRPGPTVLQRVAHGGMAEAFAVCAVKILREKTGEPDPTRIACMSWMASAPRLREWPYVPPDHELLFDVITTDGVGYVIRYGGDAEPPAPVQDDDPLFAPIQPPIPISRVDLSMCGAMLFSGALREIVIVSNVALLPPFVEQVGKHNNIIVNLGAPADRRMRLVSFPWDPDANESHPGADHGQAAAAPPMARAPATPSRPPALEAMQRGNGHAREGRMAEALRCHEEALALDPQLALAWANKAFALAGLGRQEESLLAAQRAVELDPKLVPGWINVSQALLTLGRYPQAIESAERGLALDPKSPQLHFNLATAADRTYRQPLAVKHFRAFVEHATPAMQAMVAKVEQRLRMLRG